MRSEKVLTDINSINSFHSVLSTLNKLNTSLPADTLDQFTVFNRAYQIITADIMESAESGYFNSPVFIETFTACFARYYFRAVKATTEKSDDTPEAWAILDNAKQNENTPQFIFLLMGANAHINADLPLALRESMGKKKTEELLGDVLKVDKILMKSGKQLLREFSEQSTFIDAIKRHFIFLYYRPVMYMILLWRIRAWRNYHLIKRSPGRAENYTKHSVRTARRLLLLSSYINKAI